MLNFGPYQYVVTIPSRTGSNLMVIVNKQLLLNLIYTVALPDPRYPMYPNIAGGPIWSSKYYFAVGLLDSLKVDFQSYYLLVDPCMEQVTASSTSCTKCLGPDYYLYP